jgi:CRISPR-associated helicase Cas3/CRISPR-associated endonuclease Cas3-HD
MFTAHINPDTKKEQSVKDHLENAAILAKKFAHAFSGDEYAFTTAILHDIGKCSIEFQNRILKNGKKCDHSTAGAKEINKMNRSGKLMAYCIAGHHSGLPNYGSIADVGIEGTLNARLNKKEGDFPNYKEFVDVIDTAKLCLPTKPAIQHYNNENIGATLSFFIRFIYSCLVDADFLDTEEFMSNYTINRSQNYDFDFFQRQLAKKLSSFKADSVVNQYRSKILISCLEKAKCKRSLFNLTVPTGGGKTLSSIAFAVNHLIENKLDRIIYVIPYTSIIEQTAAEFKAIFGDENVLEHHSNFDFDSDENQINIKLKLASENWDMPIIVTTNVQFFESLFSNKSSRCRKIHNISNSVIVFDEVQALPTGYLKPCIEAIKQLVQNYNSTVVMCSATQPPFNNFFNELEPQEICADISDMYDTFRRTKIIKPETLKSDMLAERLNSINQILCIVNTRKHAMKVYKMLEGEGCYHLSTLMCPAHRKENIKMIKLRLKEKLPCKVCSTRLIEAGVDVDFPVVYRAMSGLDSIIQSAGRCNREGKLTFNNRSVLGEVYLFEPEEEFVKHQPEAFKRPISMTESIMRKYEDIASPEAIKDYFEQLFEITGEGLDQKRILNRLESDVRNFSFDFEDIAHDFKLIEETTYPIIIPYDDKACLLIEKLRYSEHVSGLLRSLQAYTVNVYKNEYENLFAIGALDFISKGKFNSNEIVVLKQEQFNKLYDKNTGLNVTEKTGVGIYI